MDLHEWIYLLIFLFFVVVFCIQRLRLMYAIHKGCCREKFTTGILSTTQKLLIRGRMNCTQFIQHIIQILVKHSSSSNQHMMIQRNNKGHSPLLFSLATYQWKQQNQSHDLLVHALESKETVNGSIKKWTVVCSFQRSGQYFQFKSIKSALCD